MNGTILGVEASGQFAGLVIPELSKRGARVRGLVRDASITDAVRAKLVGRVLHHPQAER